MWEEMFGEIPHNMCVCHNCDNPSCVNPAHLFLGTQVDNIKDMVSKGRGGNHKGENNGRTKLTNDNVISIKYLLSKGIFQKYIALVYNVSQVTISRIKLGKNWSHI